MRQFTIFMQAACVVLAVAALAGCGSEKKPAVKKNGNTVKPGGNVHEHPAHGPNGGHVVELECATKPGEHQHAEWVLEDEKVLVVMLAENNKDEVGIDAEVVSIDVKAGDKTETAVLKAANRTEGEKPTATRFELADQKLLTTLSADEIDAKIRVTIDGAEFSGKIVQHKH